MEKGSQSWSIVIFCYNEEGNLEEVINNALSVLDQLTDNEKELIVVDDGSSDQSGKIADDAASKNPIVQVIHHKTNLGIGQALKSGYERAQYENVCAIPADGQFDSNELLPFSDVPDESIISFYRLQNLQYSLFRETLSFMNFKLNEWALGIRINDVNWVKVYKRDQLRKIKTSLTSSLVESEICAKLLTIGNELIEVKSEYRKRMSGKDKGASPKIVWQAFTDMFNLVWELRTFKKSLRT